MKLSMLRNLLLLDAVLLFLLGLALIVAPGPIEAVFRFKDLPAGVSYILGLWGCVSMTLAIGYFVAAFDPIRHVIWIQVGIARGVLECALGLVYVSRGIVSWTQAGVGIGLAAAMALAYTILYPRNVEAPK